MDHRAKRVLTGPLNIMAWTTWSGSAVESQKSSRVVCLVDRRALMRWMKADEWIGTSPCHVIIRLTCMTGQRSHRQEERWKSTRRPNHYGNTWIDKQPRNDSSFFHCELHRRVSQGSNDHREAPSSSRVCRSSFSDLMRSLSRTSVPTHPMRMKSSRCVIFAFIPGPHSDACHWYGILSVCLSVCLFVRPSVKHCTVVSVQAVVCTVNVVSLHLLVLVMPSF